jgi:hemolysin activation/secretion protein
MEKYSAGIPALSLVLGVLSLSSGGVAIAQSPPPASSQLPPGETVSRANPPAALDFRIGGALTAPAGADQVMLTLGALQWDGALPGLDARTRALTPESGTRLSLADVYDVVANVQSAYLQSGYPLVRVFIPVQDLNREKADIRVRVISGFVADVDTTGVPEAARSAVAGLTAGLVGKRNLRAKDLERAVLLAGEVAGVRLRSNLMAGTREGETRLILSGDHIGLQAAVSVDNRLPEDLGGEQVTVSVVGNGLLKQGDRIGLTLASSASEVSFSSDANRRYLGVFADKLIGQSGLAVGFDAALSTSNPKGAFSVLKLRNEFQRVSVTAAYPTARTRTRAANTRVSLDAITETQVSNLLGFAVPLSRDETRVLRLSHDERVALNKSVDIGLSIEFSRGLDGLGARTQADATALEPLSRVGADAGFEKLALDLSTNVQIAALGANVAVQARGQNAFNTPLLRSEQFSVASPDLISGPPSGAIVGDSAYGVRAQLERPVGLGEWQVAPFAFAANSRSSLHKPTALEAPVVDVSAYGFGARVFVPLPSENKAIVSLEWTRTDSDIPSLDDKWVGFRVTLRR